MRCLIVCIMTLLPASAVLPARAQDSDPGGQRRTALQQRIDDLRARGIDDSDPRMQKLLHFQEMLSQQREVTGDRRARGRSQDIERIKVFVTQQNLQSLFNTLADGTPASAEQYDRNIRQHRRQLAEIMASFERGHTARGQKMIESAKLEFEIAKLAQRFTAVPEASQERQDLRREIESVLRRQVRIDLDVREMKLQELAERLERQKDELRKDRDRIDGLVAKKLDRRIAREQGRSGREAADTEPEPAEELEE